MAGTGSCADWMFVAYETTAIMIILSEDHSSWLGIGGTERCRLVLRHSKGYSLNNGQREEVTGTVAFERPAPGVVKLTVKGKDPTSLTGQVLDRVREDIQKHGKVDCFIDIRWASSLPSETGSSWLKWVQVNRTSVNHVHILASSRMVAMFMNMGIGMAGVGDFVQVHGDSQRYQRELDACIRRRNW